MNPKLARTLSKDLSRGADKSAKSRKTFIGSKLIPAVLKKKK
ncbi:hypothetical protein [Paenibacillus maysiensis]|nr:hypothetical protein [Paenibacillus maysiensis]